MASVFGNVLGYLCPKNQVVTDGTQPQENRPARSSSAGRVPEGDDETDWVYDIEVRDDWQIVRKMDEEETDLPDSADEQDEDLELQDEASSALYAALHRSAPPNIMGDTTGVQRPVTLPTEPRAGSPPRQETLVSRHLNDEETAPVFGRPISHKRKRRLRALERAPAAAARAPAQNDNTRRQLGTVSTADELDKQAQNEDRERSTGRISLSKNQIRRTNLLTENNMPKKCTMRTSGKYSCLQ